MKYYFSFFIFTIFTLSAFAQIDSRNKSISIPAIESPKDTIDASVILPQKPLNSNKNFNTPKVSTNLNLPKEEFSMFPKEKFGNPGELYVKQVNKNIENLKLTPEEVEQRNGSSTDQFLGDFKSGAKFVNVVYRDHGYVDGDVIQVLVNDDIIQARIFLSGGFKGFKLDLQPGFNKIDFLALNQGSSGPNTAEFRVVDDAGNLVSANQWNLATGVKATIIITKE
tara:strand:+ start:16013 stop:16684 length:672 start_codon:yes stop_codon:yes gene_type:complete